MAEGIIASFETFLQERHEVADVQNAFEALCSSLADVEVETEDLVKLQSLALLSTPGIDPDQWRNLCAEQTRRLKGDTKTPRRKMQDYTNFPCFLTKKEWQNMCNALSAREASMEVCGFLYNQLRLRCPTEPTYASMVAVVAAAQRIDSQFELSTTLQTVKKVWNSQKKRQGKESAENEEYLLHLPATWDQLPEEIRQSFHDTLPLSPMKQPCRPAQLRATAARVVLRGNKVSNESAVEPARVSLRRELMIFLKEEREDNLLHNLQILQPKPEAAPKPLPELQQKRALPIKDGSIAGTLQKERGLVSADPSVPADLASTPAENPAAPAGSAEKAKTEDVSLQEVAESLKQERAEKKRVAQQSRAAIKRPSAAPSSVKKRAGAAKAASRKRPAGAAQLSAEERPGSAKAASGKRSALEAELSDQEEKADEEPVEDISEEKPHNCPTAALRHRFGANANSKPIVPKAIFVTSARKIRAGR